MEDSVMTVEWREKLQQQADNLHLSLYIIGDGPVQVLMGEAPAGAEVFRGIPWPDAPHGADPAPKDEPATP